MTILVTGAGGVVGQPLAEHLERAGTRVLRVGRRARGEGWLAWDMAAAPLAFEDDLDAMVHAAPLWLLPGHVQALAERGVGRIVCFSSTSALTKTASASRADRALAESLNRAETRVREESERCGIATTVLRPTMIYGYGRDANVTAIAGFIRRWRFFPVAGRAAGKRQPVHADDLAQAAAAILDNGATFGRTYDLAGGETLTYRAMVARIFEALGRPARIVGVPTPVYGAALAAAGLVKRGLTASMAARMNMDMVFDAGPAHADFGFAPQAFLRHPERDLPTP